MMLVLSLLLLVLSQVLQQCPAIGVNPINDSSNLPFVYVSSLDHNTLVNGSSNPHVADGDKLVSGPFDSHVVDAPNNLTPLFINDGNTLHDLPAPVTLSSDRSRSIPKLDISTLVDATEFLVGASMCYHE